MSAFIRFVDYCRTSSFSESLRKIVVFISNFIFQPVVLFRKIRFFLYTGCWIENILGPVEISAVGKSVKFGRSTTFYPGTLLEIKAKSQLEVGDNFTLSYGSVIACNMSVKIGNYVMVGEYSSIRDTSHSYAVKDIPFMLQDDFQEEIVIGDNVWIGRGCIILPGSIIGNNVIIGANSVVKGIVDSNGIYAGAPLVHLKNI